MNKAELIDNIVEKTSFSKADAARALDATLEIITERLKSNEEINLVGFGTFKVKKRAARKGRNLKTGEEIQIKASNAPGFKPSKVLKAALN